MNVHLLVRTLLAAHTFACVRMREGGSECLIKTQADACFWTALQYFHFWKMDEIPRRFTLFISCKILLFIAFFLNNGAHSQHSIFPSETKPHQNKSTSSELRVHVIQ